MTNYFFKTGFPVPIVEFTPPIFAISVVSSALGDRISNMKTLKELASEIELGFTVYAHHEGPFFVAYKKGYSILLLTFYSSVSLTGICYKNLDNLLLDAICPEIAYPIWSTLMPEKMMSFNH